MPNRYQEGFDAGYKKAMRDFNEILEEAAKVADAYADENQQMAADTILHDPLLAGDPVTGKTIAKSKDMMVDGCIHSSMFHAAQNIAEAIRALKR